jgi:hypothetical protein
MVDHSCQNEESDVVYLEPEQLEPEQVLPMTDEPIEHKAIFGKAAKAAGDRSVSLLGIRKNAHASEELSMDEVIDKLTNKIRHGEIPFVRKEEFARERAESQREFSEVAKAVAAQMTKNNL